ncbi:phospholipase A2 inhibitor and Ly6/PLAUR domain-containing protein-like [Cheilinus undulatus]|uniref:phospholipase A2 inhibitor and Ly6/PLAUR domain-containing protein-like n=1 Tax=Cheilinus undulatus TaxID=241271 RepID=UPI001BD32090|nr:phospholipase A2 inhibitor and Ly6/PLAUR domain-containing protein-like [Cheilinus undulatus]XP_041648017.1 phospholipase A2 inhibitor and Ly6/PLAUR domain-containing protein-like [Cheilinus undulatus]
MMKLTLCATLVWMIFSSAEALQCLNYDLIQDTISSPCDSSAELCATAGVNLLPGDDRYNGTMRMCVPPSVCAAQDEIFSVSYKELILAASIRCCNTDNCNSGILTYPELKPNGLECSTCTDQTVCNTTVECLGTQDSCFSGTVKRFRRIIQIHGCASSNLCGDHPDWEGHFFFDHFYLGTGASNCWNATLRDSALTT